MGVDKNQTSASPATAGETPKSNKNAALFSSATEEWATPQHLFNWLDARYHFSLDVCSTDDNCKCRRHYTKRENGLAQDWASAGGVCWMNPPYGKAMPPWLQKAYDEARRGVQTVALIPSRTDTSYWWRIIEAGKREGLVDYQFVPGRLKFGDAKTSAPFASVLIFFGCKAPEQAYRRAA